MEFTEYFHIEFEMLKDLKIFPFHVYLFHPLSKKYFPFLYANSPLTQDKHEFLSEIYLKGGSVAIPMKQKRTFLKSTELKEEDIPSLQDQGENELELEREKKLEETMKMREERGSFNFQEELEKAINNDDFLPMINEVRDDIELFSVRVSHTVSLARYLAETLLTEDNYTNRIAALSYLLAKNCDMKEEETLSDIFCASLFFHLGFTQMDHQISHHPLFQMSDEKKKTYRNHPGLSQHLLRKSGIDLSERAIKIIGDHHERTDGSGYPAQKNGQFIDMGAQIVGSIAHIFEYSTGKVTENVTPFLSTLRKMKNQTLSPGLEFGFSDRIYENLITLVNLDNKKES